MERLAAESACMRKHGHMSIANVPESDAVSGLLAGAAKVTTPGALAKTRREEEWWRQTAKKPTPLYRHPTLPVQAGNKPGGSVVCVERYRDDTRDWRKLAPQDVAAHFCARADRFTKMETDMRSHHKRIYPVLQRDEDGVGGTLAHDGLMAAIAVGTLQACAEGLYWSPSFDDYGAVEVREIRVPMSRLLPKSMDFSRCNTSSPRASDTVRPAELVVRGDLGPIDACRELCRERRAPPHVAVVRFTAFGDRRCAVAPALEDFRDSQLHLRTTYLRALQEMPRHVHADAVEAVDAGAIAYTSDVSVVRGPVEEGALWLSCPPRVDVIWVAIQRHPRQDDQGQYARIGEKAQVAETIDRVFACAAAHGVDALVFPPLGVGGAAGCHHPAADAGDLLRKAAHTHSGDVPRVWVCQEHPAQLRDAWGVFADALSNGRKQIVHRELVPITASPFVRPGWAAKSMAMSAGRSAALTPRTGSARPPSSARTKTAIESAGRAVVC